MPHFIRGSWLITIYRKLNNEWVFGGYECPECGKGFSTKKYVANHPNVCTRINRIKQNKKDDTQMLIQRVTRNGETFYRRGQNGELFKTKQEAENNSRGKKKGADGKACWEGYRYAGTKDGSDKCVKVKGR